MASRSRPAGTRAEDRAARVAALLKQLDEAVAGLTTSANWAAMLRASATFHQYSFSNVMLLLGQAQERGMTLTSVAGFHAWKKLDRSVRKGERGLAILAPMTRKADVHEGDQQSEPTAPGDGAGAVPGARRVFGWRTVRVFDLSQTEGKPLPEPDRMQRLVGEDAAGLWDLLAGQVEAAGFELRREPDTDPQRLGWTDYADRVVSVRPDLSGVQATAVLAHELAHVHADHENRKIPRAQKETEAESIAYVILGAHGMDSAAQAVPYVAGWSNGDAEIVKEAATTVHRTAGRILADLGVSGPVRPDAAPSVAKTAVREAARSRVQPQAAPRVPNTSAGP